MVHENLHLSTVNDYECQGSPKNLPGAAAMCQPYAGYDLIKSVKRRFGASRVRGLREKVLALIEEERGRTEVDADVLKQRVSELFKDFE